MILRIAPQAAARQAKGEKKSMLNRLNRKIRHFFYFLRYWASGTGNHFCGIKTHFQVPVSRRYSSGDIEIGKACVLGWPDTIRYGSGEILLQAKSPQSHIRIGDRVHINNNVFMIAQTGISIGNDSLIGFQCVIADFDMHGVSIDARHSSRGVSREIIIEENVWIGARCFICKGVHIGKNSVIGANSVVTSNIPCNVVAAGAPAKVIRHL